MENFFQCKDTLIAEVGAIAIKSTDELDTLVLSANALASYLCCDQTPQFSILEVDDNDENIYRIVYAEPRQSQRHSIDDTGKFDFPVKKEALLATLNSEEALLVNDAINNPLARYARIQLEKKEVKHFATALINSDDSKKWILLFDRKCDTPFVSEEKQLLDQTALIISDAIKRINADRKERKDIIQSVEDLFKNPLVSIGLAAKISQRLIDKGETAKVAKHLEIILAEVARLEDDLSIIGAFTKQLLKKRSFSALQKISLGEILEVFSGISLVSEFDRHSTFTEVTDDKLAYFMTEKIAGYLQRNQNGDRQEISISPLNGKNPGISLKIFASAFQPFKIGIDYHINNFLLLAKTLGWQAKITQGALELSLPLAEE
jgi:signal transduction histidine kinase